MKALYVDNYKGFSKSLIPIKNINFLVGENSTGKSTILNLLYLLSNPFFWFGSFEFKLPNVDFGCFNDLVNLNSNNKSYFQIGLINESPKNKTSSFHILKFIEKKGMPYISEYSYSAGDKIITISYQRTLKYRHFPAPVLDNDFKIIKFFKKIIKSQFEEYTDYSIYKGYYKKYSLSLFMIANEIQDILNKDNGKKKSFRLPMASTEDLLISNLLWIAPIRTKPKKTYDEYQIEFSSEGKHIPYLIKKKLDQRIGKQKFLRFIKKYGKQSSLFDSIDIKKFGKTITSPFELDIIYNNNSLNINNVGYGVSQALRIIIEFFDARNFSTFAIQQPEIHLHPKAQASIGELIFDLSFKDKKEFYIETHSDYLIDRFRIKLKKSKNKNLPHSQILFFERNMNGNQIIPISINTNGQLSPNIPKNYRNFFLKEQLSFLEL